MKWVLLVFCLVMSGFSGPEDVLAPYGALKTRAQKMSMGELVGAFGRELEGKPYEERTLEKPGPESLVVRFSSFDCFTLMETSLAAARSLKKGASFPEELQDIRYRNGQIEGYASRLHYTVDWAYNNSRMGLVQDVTREMGGIPRRKTINFMTTHRKAYEALKDEGVFQSIADLEKMINQRTHYYLPADRISNNEHLIREGDLIACTTSITGLDVTHVGIAVRVGKGIHLLHASKKAGVVIISEASLGNYVASQPKMDGVMIFRPLD